MRLTPPITVEEALSWLADQAAREWETEPGPELQQVLTDIATAMVGISAAEIPEEIDPWLM